MKTKVICKECGKEEMVTPSRAKKYVTCSTTCMGKFNSKRYGDKVEKICEQCNKTFLVKKSQAVRRKTCSKKCHNESLPLKFSGKNNPNFKDRKLTSDGYLFCDDSKIKIHIKVVMNLFDIIQIPKGLHVHHRDCNKLNNKSSNLVVLSASDHVWLHKQFGNAVLDAFCNEKIDLETLAKWSSDYEKSTKLLPLSIIEQSVVLKQGELLENLFKEDNQQPSLSSNTFEGSETNSQIQTSNVEDSNADTSALPQEIG